MTKIQKNYIKTKEVLEKERLEAIEFCKHHRALTHAIQVIEALEKMEAVNRELLEACKSFIEVYGSDRTPKEIEPSIKKIIQAIANAEGKQ